MAEGRKASKTGYEIWMEKEGIPVHEGYGIEDVREVLRRPWSRTGGLGAFIQLKGLEGLTGMYVGEIPPGQALNPEKHLYEEIIYILKGIGSTEVWLEGKPKQRFEWTEGSLFAPPLNAWHRLYNGSREPALYLALTNAPLLVDLFHDGGILYSSDYVFPDRYLGQEKYFEVGEREDRGANHNWVWNTNFIPDVRNCPINAQERKGAGVEVTIFEMSQNALVGHMTEWPVGRYHKAHYHLGGAVLLILKSKGYTLMWPRELGIHPFEEGHGDKVVQVNWGVGSVFSPPTGWFHQHFNTGPDPARQLATRYGSINYRVGIWDALEGAGVMISVKKGGTLIEYEDQDPEINARYEKTMRREGLVSQMPPLAEKTRSLPTAG